MYLHIGQNVVVPEADIIGIFDLDNTTNSRITRQFLSFAEKEGRVVSVSDELPNSFVICDAEETAWRCAGLHQKKAGSGAKSGNTQIYLSQLSAHTLSKRSESSRII